MLPPQDSVDNELNRGSSKIITSSSVVWDGTLYEDVEVVVLGLFCAEQRLSALEMRVWALANAKSKAWACGTLDPAADSTNFHHPFERFETNPSYNLVGL